MTTISLKTIRTFLSVIVLLLASSMMLAYIYSAYFEEPSVSYNPLPFPLVDKVVPAGGVATATAYRCNTQKTPISYRSSRQLRRENSSQPALILESVLITIEPGCSNVSTRINVVPETTPPGFYRFSGVAVIKGLIVDHEVGWNTDVFEVVAKLPEPAAVAPVVHLTENNRLKIEVKP